MRSARGIHGFIRYWGPANGGINSSSEAAYHTLLKVFLTAGSLRWFMDTFLTVENIKKLLKDDLQLQHQLKTEWYFCKLANCAQENSSFPLMIWMKKAEFWKDEDIEDGVLLTMIQSMECAPVIIENLAETPGNPSRQLRKKRNLTSDNIHRKEATPIIDLTSGRKSAPSAVTAQTPGTLACATQGCVFTTKHKSSLTNHMKACRDLSPVFACPVRGCTEKHSTKADSQAHQREHAPQRKRTPKPKTVPKAKLPKIVNPLKKARGNPQKRTVTTRPKPTPTSSNDTALYVCPQPGCGESHSSSGAALLHQAQHVVPPPSTIPPHSSSQSTATGLTVFKCPAPGCGKEHVTVLTAQRHSRKHQAPSPSPPIFKCSNPSCVKVHETAASAQRHSKKHQTEDLSLSPKKPLKQFKCSFPDCLKSHVTADLAQRHQQKHQKRQRRGEKELTCPECKVFTGNLASMLTHVAGCRAELTCPVCAMKSASAQQLLVHVVVCAGNRKRSRADDGGESWAPTRNCNNKTHVRLHWTTSEVRQWLRLVQLDEYSSCFESEKVDGRILLTLTETEVKGSMYNMKNNHATKFFQLREAFGD